METPVIKIYRALAPRRALLAVALLALLGLCAALAARTRLDNSLIPFLPDSSPELRRSAELMDAAPFARLLLAQLSVNEKEAAWALAPAADDLTAALDPHILAPLWDPENPPDPAALPPLLPALCDAPCRARLLAGLTPEKARLRLAELKTALSSLGGEEDLFWRTDPFRWRSELFPKLPRPWAGPGPDLLSGYPVSGDGRHLLLALKPGVSMNDADGAEAALRHLDEALRRLPPGLTAQTVGAHRHSAANASAIKRDLALTLPLAFALLLTLYLTMVRSLGAFWLFLTPAAAMLIAAAGLDLALPAVSGLALGFGAAILGLAEDYAVYIHFALRRAPDPETALRQAVRPLTLSAAITGAGFAVLLFSAIPAIRQLALFAALSLWAGYLWALIPLPHFPAMDRPREFSPLPPEGGAEPRAPLVVALFLALLAALLAVGQKLETDFSPRGLNLAEPELLAAQREVAEIWGSRDEDRQSYFFEGASPAEALALAGAAAADLRARGAGKPASLADLCPPPDVQTENLRGWAALAAFWDGGFKGIFLEEAAAQGFGPQAFEPFFDWLSAPAAVDPERLAALGLGFWTDYYLAAKDGRHYALLEIQGPEKLSGRAINISAPELERAFSQALTAEKRLPAAAALVCLIILLAALKNKADALAALLPALTGLAAALLFNLARGRPLGLAEVSCLPLIIGLGADYGIVAVSEARKEARLGAGRAVLTAGLTTVAGVGILVLARHPALRALGETITAGLAGALPMAALVLPRLYAPLKRTEKN